MTVKIFPCNTPQRVPLPLPPQLGPGDFPSWRVIFGREQVPVFVEGESEGAADDEGYFPVNAVYLEACPCKATQCPDVKVFIDDALSSCSVFLNQAFIQPKNGETQQPQTLDFKIKGSGASIPTTLLHGTVNLLAGDVLDPLGPPSQRGLLGAVSGILFNQFELWARVRDVEGGTPQPVQVRVMMIVDRVGGQMTAVLGEIAGGGDLPIVNAPPV